MLIDTHCHLDFPDFAEDLPAYVARAEAAGVGRMVTISTQVARFATYAAIAERFSSVWCSVGTHPHHADEELDIFTEDLVRLSQHPRCVAIGEAGLDYHYDSSPRAAQAQGLRTHIAAARITQLPLVIHSREADDDMAAILREEMGKGAFPAILHCFTAGEALAMAGVELGLYVSFSGILTFRNAEQIREIAKAVPADRLLVETEGERRRETPAVREAPGRDHGDLHGIGDARDEHQARHVAAVGGRLVARDEERIGSVLRRPHGVAAIDDGGDHLAPVFVGRLDEPVPLSEGEVDDGDLFLQEDLRVAGRPGEEQGGVGPEGLVREPADLADGCPRLVGVQGPRGEDAQAARVGDSGHHARDADPAHAGQDDRVPDAEQFRDPGLHDVSSAA